MLSDVQGTPLSVLYSIFIDLPGGRLQGPDAGAADQRSEGIGQRGSGSMSPGRVEPRVDSPSLGSGCPEPRRVLSLLPLAPGVAAR